MYGCTLGELVRLKFLFSGSPLPELTIFHNGEQVTDSRVVTEVLKRYFVTQGYETNFI